MRSHVPNDLAELRAALAKLDADYDPSERMLRHPFHSPGYHTAYAGEFTHSTRAALEYALALLDSGEEDRFRRAVEVLDRLLALQDTDPESDTYGIWSWFLEEPLEQMSPPDWNWADFCGTCLIQIAMDHRGRLPEDLARRLDESLHHAARSIMRRDVGPGYTNIALMGTHVTYTIGEFYEDTELLDYARMRLRRFEAHTREHSAFAEYNSPTYTTVAIRILARMQRDIEDPSARPIVDWLHHLVWGDVARHFHPPTRQWSGPHSRCYATLLRPDTLAFFQRALGDAVSFFSGDLPPDVEANRLQPSCPEEYVPLFQGLGEPREVVQVYSKGDPPVVGHTYLDETAAIGSTNRGTFWNQQRCLVAYWGDSEHPIALRVRLLHDDYDYSSGMIFTRQAGPHVLAAVVFGTDGGDTHPGLDKVEDATIKANDLRLRFRVINMPADAQLPAELAMGRRASMEIGNAMLGLDIAHVAFDGFEPFTEASHSDAGGCLDVVLHARPEREIDFSALNSAAVVFGVSLTASDVPAHPVRVTRNGGRLAASWDTPRGRLELSVPERPGPMAEITRAVRGIDGG